MKQHIILSAITAMALAATLPTRAQNDNSTFSVMTINVDGLPGKFLFFNVNEDGPKSAGSEDISIYMAAKDCDIVAMQEDFNYRWEIWSRLFANYEHDEWTGGVIYEDMEDVDFIHPQNIKLKCDGLNMAWKRECKSTSYERVTWNRSFGKFSHDFDDIVTKGFRRHEVTLHDGTELVVYNMHMDASNERDERLGNDTKDRETRVAQWEQLRQHIMERLDKRPVLIVGDMNSYYYRDPIKTTFIDSIQSTGLATVNDVWVEKQWNGIYPELGSEPRTDETLDKVLYINPIEAEYIISPMSVELDRDGYNNAEGKPLGDHYPLIAHFAITPTDLINSIDIVDTATSANDEWYSLQGTKVGAKDKGIIISRNGQKKLQK